MGVKQSAKDELIDNLRAEVAQLRIELQGEKNRHRQERALLEGTTWARLRELAVHYGAMSDGTPRLIAYLGALQAAVDAADPIRSPTPDQTGVTSRTASAGNEEGEGGSDTPTEAAYLTFQRYRNLVHNIGFEMEQYVNGVHNRISSGGARKSKTTNRDRSAHERWHVEEPNPQCRWCA